MGLSYEKSTLNQRLMTSTNGGLIALFKLLAGTGILRIGGNSVDGNLWVGTGVGGVAGNIATGDVDSLAGFLARTGWKCLYGINLGGFRSGVQTPAKAAAEVAYVASKLGIYNAETNAKGMLYAVEIGNEPENYGLGRGPFYRSTPPWSESTLETIWGEFQRAILQVTPGVPMTGPSDGQFGIESYTVPFGEHENAKVPNIAALTQHYYTGDAKATHPAPSVGGLLHRPDRLLESILTDMKTAVSKMVPGSIYRMTECNSYYDGGAPGVSNTYASTLWVIDFLFTCAQYGAAGVNMHGGGDQSPYVPIADNRISVDPDTNPGVRPVYYGMLFAAMAGHGDVYVCDLVPASGGSLLLNATAWVIKSRDGWNIIVNNKAAENLQVDLKLLGGIRPKKATVIELTQSTSGGAPDLTATRGVRIQGSEVDSSGSFRPEAAYALPVGKGLRCFCPCLSAVLIQIVA